MNIGFIGAGRVGVTLGRYFCMHDSFKKIHNVVGYYDVDKDALEEASKIMNVPMLSFKQLVDSSDIIFVTVVDGAIEEVGNQISEFDIQGKIVCHCSGALASDVFSNIDKLFSSLNNL